MTTQEQRAEWSALAQAATPGEWYAERVQFKDTDAMCIENKDWRVATLYPPLENRAADAAFIAAARTAVPQLLADVDALTQERDALAASVQGWTDTALELLADRSRFRSAIVSLTPGGSEFYDNPERCAEWVQERLSTTGKIAAERNELRKERDALSAELASYKRQAAYISNVIDSEGKYVP